MNPYRTPCEPPPQPQRRPPFWWPVVKAVYPFATGWRWMRRLYGGRWEEHYISLCAGFLWLPVDAFGERVPLSMTVRAREEWGEPVVEPPRHRAPPPPPPKPEPPIAVKNTISYHPPSRGERLVQELTSLGFDVRTSTPFDLLGRTKVYVGQGTAKYPAEDVVNGLRDYARTNAIHADFEILDGEIVR